MHHPQQTKQHHLIVLGHCGVVANAGMPKLCGIEVLQDVGKNVVWHAQRRVLQVTGQEGLELVGTKDCMHLIGFRPVPESKQGVLAGYLHKTTGEVCVSLA